MTSKKSLLLFFSFSFLAFQQSNLVFIKSVPVKAEHMSTDNLSNIYLINNDVLQKFDPQGNLLKTFSNMNYGKISSIDASNPMKIILFYRNFLKVVFLDNTLTENGKSISIEELGYPGTQFICSSHDNGMWLYNQQNFELLRFDQNLSLVIETGNLAQLLDLDLKPYNMLEYNNRLYVNNPSTGILIFDIFGTYYNTIPIKNIHDFQFRENDLVYYQNGKLNTFNIKTLDQTQTSLPDSAALSVRITNDKLYLLQKETLGIYTINFR
jgi:hypothetical protein